MHYRITLLSLLFLCTHVVAQNNVQCLIDSGEIKHCMAGDGILFLAGKGLKSLEGLQNVPDATSITFIDLSDNQISELGGCWFQHFPSLTQLWLNKNLIEDLSGLINNPGLENLRELHCTHNNLQVLDLQQLCALPMLYILNTGFNKIKCIKPKRTWSLNHLEVLFLNNNELDSLPSYVFSGCPNLQALYLHDNVIKVLEPYCLSGLSNMRLLFMHNNALTTIPSHIFRDLQRLRILYLRNNSIQLLEKDWAVGLERLNILDLLHNNLGIADVKNSWVGHVKNLKNFYV